MNLWECIEVYRDLEIDVIELQQFLQDKTEILRRYLLSLITTTDKAREHSRGSLRTSVNWQKLMIEIEQANQELKKATSKLQLIQKIITYYPKED